MSILHRKAYTILIFYHLNEFTLSQFLQKFALCSCYEIFKFPTKPMIIVCPIYRAVKKFQLDRNKEIKL